MRSEQFEPVVTDARRARLFAQQASGISRPTSERIALLVSELASNVILHARTPFSIATSRDGSVVRVEVHDDSPAMPKLNEVEVGATSGRGIYLVSKIASRWGVEKCAGDGKTVWVEVDDHER